MEKLPSLFKKKIYQTFILLIVSNVNFSSSSFGQGRIVLDGPIAINIHGGTETDSIFLVVNNSASNAITSTSSGYILSEGQFNILRWVISNNFGNFVIPFGDLSANKIPVEMAIASGGTAGGYIDFSTYATGEDNLPLPSGVSSIDHVDVTIPSDGAKIYDRYWFVNGDSYTVKPSGQFSVAYNAASMSGDLVYGTSPLAVQYYKGTEWLIAQLGTDNLAGLVSSVPFSNSSFFNTFTLVEYAFPLPEGIIGFNAAWANDEKTKAIVFWETVSEQDNDYFDVEYSNDGISWAKIGEVDGAGNSSSTIEYSFVDQRAFSAKSYYRLKQVSFDGAFSFSNIVLLNKEINGPNVILFPNPAADQFSLYFEGFDVDQLNVQILDGSGRKVLEFDPKINKEPTQMIQVSGFSSGVYFVHVNSENESITKKVILKN